MIFAWLNIACKLPLNPRRVGMRSADKIFPAIRASMSAGGGGDARFFAAQRPHGKKFVPAGIAA